MSRALHQVRIEAQDSKNEQGPELTFGTQVIALLEESGFEAYIAGGFCRDLMRGEVPKDVDIATSAKPSELLALSVPDVSFQLIEAAEAYPVVQARKDGMVLEIATFRKDVYSGALGETRTPDRMDLNATLEDDANRRDLTVNALYYNPLTREVIDPLGQGMQDLEAGIVRFVGDPHQRIAEDRIRILRAVRFKNKMGFDYEPETQQALAQASGEVLHIKSRDRIRTELAKMLVPPSRTQALQDLNELGILQHLVPEITQSPDLLERRLHTMRGLPPKPSGRLVWAALLQGIGRPFQDVDTPVDGLDEQLATKVMRRLVAPNKETAEVAWLVRNRRLVNAIADMTRSQQLALVRPELMSPGIRSTSLFDDLLALMAADGATAELCSQAAHIRNEINQSLGRHALTVKEEFGIDGQSLIRRFGLQANDRRLSRLGGLTAGLDRAFQDKPEISKEGVLALADARWNKMDS